MRPLAQEKSPSFNKGPDEKGFTLLELLIGMAIFAIGSLAITNLQAYSVNVNANARRSLEVETIVARMVEDIKDLAWNDANADGVIDNFDVDGDGVVDQLWVTDTDGDGAGGLEDFGAGAADHVVGSGDPRIGHTNNNYRFSINVAPAVAGAANANTLTINIIAQWTLQGRTRNYSVLFIKARDV
jgi:prepilin-type N-terminal cleavage/methylation domain-containing protein